MRSVPPADRLGERLGRLPWVRDLDLGCVYVDEARLDTPHAELITKSEAVEHAAVATRLAQQLAARRTGERARSPLLVADGPLLRQRLSTT